MPGNPAIARGSMATVIDGFPSIRAWSTMRDDARMKADYSDWQMAVDRDGRNGPCLRMGFTPRVASADIWGSVDIEEPIHGIGLWVQNVTRRPCRFSLSVVEADGSIYTGPTVDLTMDGAWHRLEFPISGFTLAPWSSDENGRLDYPIAKVVPVLSGMEQGTPVTVRLDELSVTRPAPVRLKLKSVSIPERAASGSDLRVSLSVIPTESMKSSPCELLLVHDGVVMQRAQVMPTKWTVGEAMTIGPVNLKLPSRMWPGVSQIVFRMPDVRIEGHEDGVMGTVRVSAPATPLVRYSVRTRNGIPQLFEDRRPMSATGFMYENPNPDQVRAFGRAGIHLYWLECRQVGWVGDNQYDYKFIDELLAELFRCDPQARVIPFFYVDLASPLVRPETDWWQAEHPNDLCRDADGKVFVRYGHQTVSFASEAWRRDAGTAVERFVRRMEASPYADRIAGYQPCAGGSYEWMYHGGQDSQFLDYSKPTVRRFREWLRAKYGGKVGNLRKAWHDAVTFETARIPSPEERRNCSMGSLRDPASEARVIDYYTFLSELTADTIDYFCGITKRASGGRKVAGVFYGYVMEQMYGGYCTQHTGHFALGRLLESRNVDFLMSPTSYWNREPGNTGGYMTAIGSVRLHGKLWINQADIRTHLSEMPAVPGRCDTEAQTIGVLRREFAMDLAAGVPVYWYSFSAPWFGPSEPVMSNIRRMDRIDVDANGIDRGLTGDRLAVVVSGSPAAYTGLTPEPLRSLVYLQREALHRSGIPFDVFLDSDLGNPKMPLYKAYLFLDAVHIPRSRAAWIDAHLKKDRRVLSWVWAPGMAGAALSIGNVSSLCGVHLAMSTDPGIATVKPDAGYGPTYGSEGAFSPILYPDDPSARTIGKLTSPTPIAGKPGICVKSEHGWTSVYSTAPRLSPEMVRAIARMAGIHVYSEANDPIYIGEGYIGIHAKEAGDRHISLPHPATVVDCFTGHTIGSNVSDFTVPMESFGTGIYRIVGQ